MFFHHFIRLFKYNGRFFYLFLFQAFILHDLWAESSVNWEEFLKNTTLLEMQPLSGGLTNDTYKCNINENFFVIRFGNKDTNRLSINRGREIKFHNFGNLLGISPKIYYSDPKKGILITKFITGKFLKSQDLKDNKILMKVVSIIKKLHLNKIEKTQKTGTYYLCSINNLLMNLDFKTGNDIQNIRYAVSIAKAIYDKMPAEKYQVASHNDFFARNLINDNGKFWLIDWEYANWGSQYNDLSSLVMEDELNTEQEKIVLNMYFGFLSLKQYERFKFVCALYSLQSSVWAFSQLQNNTKSKNSHIFKVAINHHLNKFWKNIKYIKNQGD